MKKQTIKSRFKRMACFGTALALLASTVPTATLADPSSLPSAQALVPPSMDDAVVFFDADKAEQTFNDLHDLANQQWDIYDHDIVKDTLGNALLSVDSSTDGRIEPTNDVWQIDYEALVSANASEDQDGSYTIVGFGGAIDNARAYATKIKFRLKADDENVAQYFRVDFFLNGELIPELAKEFDTWMTESGYNTTTISTDTYTDYYVNIPGGYDPTNIQGMKFTFNRAEKAGTIFVDEIVFCYDDNSVAAVFEDFTGDAGVANTRNNPLTDRDGLLPFLRTEETMNSNGTAGYNYSSALGWVMWTMSTSDANVVNNTASGSQKALQIKYQMTDNHKTYAELISASTYVDETLMAMTIKGEDSRVRDLIQAAGKTDVKVDEILNVVLYNGTTKVATIPFTDFFVADELEKTTPAHTDMSEDTYVTYYAKLAGNYSFNKISFEFPDDDVYSGNIYVKNIYFPRYSSTVNHYYDNVLQTGLTESEVNTLKYGDVVGYTDRSTTIYKLNSTNPASGEVTVGLDSSTYVIDVYYVSEVPYTVKFVDAGGNVLKEIPGEGTANDNVSYSDYEDEMVPGYKLDPDKGAPADMILTISGKNEMIVNVVKDQFGYTVEYYKNGDLAETDNQNTAEFGADIPYDSNKYAGYEVEKVVNGASDGKISLTASDNVVKVYYIAGDVQYDVIYKDGDAIIDTDENKPGKTDDIIKTSDFKDTIPDGYVYVEDGKEIILKDGEDNELIVNIKKGEFGYTVRYHKNGELVDTDNQKAAEFGSDIPYDSNKYAGYAVEKVIKGASDGKISSTASNNVIDVYYISSDVQYDVIYKDGDTIVDTDENKPGKTDEVIKTSDFKDSVPDGYVYVEDDEEIILKDGVDNKLIVNVKKGEFGYTVEYYKNGELAETDNQKVAEFDSNIPYDDQKYAGYEVDKVVVGPSNGKVSSTTADNVIKVYYESKDLEYDVIYKDGDEVVDTDEDKPGKTDEVIKTSDFKDSIPDGYVYVEDDEEIILKDGVDNKLIVNVKKGEFGYTVEYYKNGELAETDNQKVAEFGSDIPYDDDKYDGYEVDDVVVGASNGKVSSTTADNVIKVYYKSKDLEYDVIYKDGDEVVDTDEDKPGKTDEVIKTSDFKDSVPDGYVYVEDDEEIILKDGVDNKLIVNVKKGEFGYTVEYYKNGELAETDNQKVAEFGSDIPYDDDKYDGYEVDDVVVGASNGKVSSTTADNVIKVYYKSKDLEYDVIYKDGDEVVDIDEDKPGKTDEIIKTSDFKDSIPDGYEYVEDDKEIILKDGEDNKIIVTIKKGEYDYTVKYYQDNVLVDTVDGTGKFGDKIPYDTTPETGYNFDKVTPDEGTAIITTDSSKNIVCVYFTKIEPEKYPYKIEYYYDGKLSEVDTYISEAMLGSIITLDKDKLQDKFKDGYVLDKISTESGELIITVDEETNVIKVYLKSIPETPTTKDNANVTIWCVVLVAGALLMALSLKARKRVEL